MKYTLALIALVTALAFAGGEFATGNAETFKISGYTKAWFYMWGEEGADPANGFRAYNWTSFQANLNDYVKGVLGTQFATYSGNMDIQVCHAYLEADIAPEFSFKAGQFKVPFGWAFTCSGGGVYFLDRAALASTADFGAFGGRDIGVNAHAQFDMVGIDLAYFNGTGVYTDADTSITKQFVANLTFDITDWMTLAGGVSMIGQPELSDTLGTIESWSATGIDAYLLVDYPIAESADLIFEGEFLSAGVPGPDLIGSDKVSGTDFYAMLGVKFGIDGGFLTAIMPAVRYESLDPAEYVVVGGDGALDKITVIDFCINFYNGAKHDIQLGGRNVGYEADVDGYTDMYLAWRMNF